MAAFVVVAASSSDTEVGMDRAKKALSVYIHIPFCLRKCLYCDFLSIPGEKGQRQAYVKALCREIAQESRHYTGYRVDTVYIGGGTPSVLTGEQTAQIMGTLREFYELSEDCEISMEVNPGTATREKIRAWVRAGINRLSIGLQSMVDEELRALGRIHDSGDFFRTYELAVEEGFQNINVDLMSAIPGQSTESWKWSLEQVTELVPRPTHISAYSLIIEEGTPFFEQKPVLPDEDEEREMYRITGDILFRKGYRQYEISNYAQHGFRCRHNEVYWRRGNYAGFGPGAASMVENERFSNTSDIGCYINTYLRAGEEKNCFEGETDVKMHRQILSVAEQMEEFMFLGLRMTKGVSRQAFFRTFGRRIEQVYPGIVEDFCAKGLLQCREDSCGEEWIFLTPYGIDVSNVVMAQFLLSQPV